MLNLIAEGYESGVEGVDDNFHPDHLVKDGDFFMLNNEKVTAIYTPGHMGNHVCYQYDKILFSGGNGELFSNDYVEAVEMKKFLIKNGINENDILIETRSRNTHENIKNSIKICEEKNLKNFINNIINSYEKSFVML